MEKRTYKNKRNGHKYIEVVRYACGHYYAVQYMYWPSSGATNKLGSRTGRRFRFTKATLDEILQDYERVRA